jgi:hypothetical protein
MSSEGVNNSCIIPPWLNDKFRFKHVYPVVLVYTPPGFELSLKIPTPRVCLAKILAEGIGWVNSTEPILLNLFE